LQDVGEVLLSQIHKILNYIEKNGKMPGQLRDLLVYQMTRREGKLTVGTALLSASYKVKLLYEIIVDYQRGFQLLIKFQQFVRYLRKGIKGGSTLVIHGLQGSL
jgi:hypothetical protein